MAERTLIRLFASFFKTGLFTFGGGYAMIPLIRRETVERRRWLDDGEFLDALAVAQSLPGPVAVNASVYVGHRLAGVPGAAVAALGAVLPSFLVMLALGAGFAGVKDEPAVAAAFMGIRPAVAALVAAAAWSLAAKTGTTPFRAGLAAAAALAVWLGGVSPAWVVAALAVLAPLLPIGAGPESGDA